MVPAACPAGQILCHRYLCYFSNTCLIHYLRVPSPRNPFSACKVYGKRITLSKRSIATQTDAPFDWTTLPDVCLLVIFDYLPTRELLQVGSICRNWKAVQTSACRSKRVLTILCCPGARKHLLECESKFCGADDISAFARLVALTSVNLTDLNGGYRRQLLETFPGVTKLSLSVLITSDQVSQIALLLDGWRSTLISLKLVLQFQDDISQKSSFQKEHYLFLIGSLNKLNSLKYFTLECSYSLFSEDPWVPPNSQHIELSILARLQSFSISTQDFAPVLCDSFTKYALSNDNLLSIQVDNRLYNDGVSQYLQLDDKVLAKLKHMKVIVQEFNQPEDFAFSQCTRLFSRLISLTYLDFYIEEDSISYQTIISSLVRLKQLVHLKLVINTEEFNNDEGLEDDEELENFPQLPSVKKLTLSPLVHYYVSDPLRKYRLALGFPSLDLLTAQITFRESDSDEEDSDNEDYSDSDNEPLITAKQKHCAAQLYKRIKALKINRTVITFQLDDENIWTPAELEIDE